MVVGLPWVAWRTLNRTKKVVKTVVGRARQARRVNGLSRYTAATETGFQLSPCRGEVWRLEAAATPDAAISYRQSAERMSKAVYRMTLVRRPKKVAGEGSKENSGKNKGA